MKIGAKYKMRAVRLRRKIKDIGSAITAQKKFEVEQKKLEKQTQHEREMRVFRFVRKCWEEKEKNDELKNSN